MRVVVSWSGGKDCCLACYKVISEGFEVSHLLNFTFEDVGEWTPHGLAPELTTMQSEAMEIPIVQREVTWDTYEHACMESLEKEGNRRKSPLKG